jgi:hypothetical protein
MTPARRWPRKDGLVLDAIQHYGATHPAARLAG